MRQKKRFQNKVAESSLLLPAAILIYLLLWMAGDVSYADPATPPLLVPLFEEYLSFPLSNKIIGLCGSALTTALLIELNNRNSLLRIRSRMVSSTMLILWGCMPFLQSMQTAQVIVLCILVIYHALFQSYQQQNPVGKSLLAFSALGIGSLFFPPLLLYAPFLWIAFSVFRALSLRTFFAGILGILLPYWLLLSVAYCLGTIELCMDRIHDWIQMPVISYAAINSHQWLSVGIVIIASIVSISHFLRNSFQDKFRIRIIFHFLIYMEAFWSISLFLLPQYFNCISLVLIMNSSPLIAHFFALTYHRLSNLFFILLLITLLILAVYNIWMPSYNFF